MEDVRINTEVVAMPTEKKIYTSPKLIRHGKVEELTLQRIPNPSDPT